MSLVVALLTGSLTGSLYHTSPQAHGGYAIFLSLMGTVGMVTSVGTGTTPWISTARGLKGVMVVMVAGAVTMV